MSDEDLDAMELRVRAAHEGPWELQCETPSGLIWSVRCRRFSDGTPGNLILSGHRPICEFVQHSREDVPALIDEVRSLRELLRECTGYMEHDDARCEHFEKCQCGLTDLLQRIAAALGEAG